MVTFTPVSISAAGIRAVVLPFGARLMQLHVDSAVGPRNVVLGLTEPRAYGDDRTAMGAVCGRYANRIGGAHFDMMGRTYRLDANEGANCLHGGRLGFGARPWQVDVLEPSAVTLSLTSAAGDMGFPGRCEARARYALSDNRLTVTLEARVDAPCPVNLVAHPYFNLHGGGTIAGHEVTIFASRRLVTDAALIPTGEMIANAGTYFDFVQPRILGDHEPRYDTTYLRDDSGFGLAARLKSVKTGISMDVFTDQPSVQFYDGGGLPQPFTGLCLEVQRLPDAPNHAHFPSSLVQAGEVSHQCLELVFHREGLHPPHMAV